MAVTGLSFYRKNQSLTDLLTERPQNLDALRLTMQKAINESLSHLHNLEREFNSGCKHEDEVRKIARASRSVMNSLEITYMNSHKQITEIVERTLEPSEVFRFNLEHVNLVKEYHRKLVEFVPDKIQPIVDDIKQMLELLKSYCTSFSPPRAHGKKSNRYLESCFHYELKRRELQEAINYLMDNIASLHQGYHSDDGVSPKNFSLSSNELARAWDCGDITYILIFPEVCGNICGACAGMQKWINEDSLYVEYLKNDIVTVEKNLATAEQNFHDVVHREAVSHHALKVIKQDITSLENEMGKIKKREEKLLCDIDHIEQDTRVTIAELAAKEEEMKTYKIDSLAVADLDQADYNKHVKEIADQIAMFRQKIPENKHKIQSIKIKQREVFERRQLLNETKNKRSLCDRDILLAKGALFEAKLEKEELEEAARILKDCYFKKTNPGLTRKIFNNVPVIRRQFTMPQKRPHRLKPLPTTGSDHLARATKIAAKGVRGDWPKLYRALPFKPIRGDAEKDADIVNVVLNHTRATHSSQAQLSLEKWRRINTLANVESLKDGLLLVHRDDLRLKIEDRGEKRPLDTHKRARENWAKVRKFKMALGKIIDLKKKAVELRRERIREQLAREKVLQALQLPENR